MDGYGASPPVALASSAQRAWDSPVVLHVAEGLLAAAVDPTDKARLLASRAPGSGDWLQAVPLANIGLRLDDHAVSIAVALRLGAPAVHAHVCACGAALAANGHHGLSWVRSAGRHSRQARAKDIIHRALHAAGIPALLEPSAG